MQVPILSGIYADQHAEFRTSYPRNLVPVPLPQGISQGFLRPADGLELFATGLGADRGSIRWGDACYRVSGSSLIRVERDGSIVILGSVGDGGPVEMDYSFDRLAIASGGRLYYYHGGVVTQVTDPDLGTVLDVLWEAGYFVTTDGTSIVVTDLADPASVNPLRYGSSEGDPDPIKAISKINRELFALNRFSIEAFENVPGQGSGFPFERVSGATVSRGIIGRRAYTRVDDTFFFVGGGRSEMSVEPPSVYVMTPGGSEQVATREVDIILRSYTEAQLKDVVVESRCERGHKAVYIHLPDRCLVYDLGASAATRVPVWYTLDSGLAEPAQYRARGLLWCYDRWLAADPGSNAIWALTTDTMEHGGQKVGWGFGTLVAYNDGNEAIVHEVELVGLPGRVKFGEDPVIWTSYSHDGETWGQEHAISCGKAGERQKRVMWRKQGKLRHCRMQRFRGTSDARMSIAALRVAMEPLSTRSVYG